MKNLITLLILTCIGHIALGRAVTVVNTSPDDQVIGYIRDDIYLEQVDLPAGDTTVVEASGQEIYVAKPGSDVLQSIASRTVQTAELPMEPGPVDLQYPQDFGAKK